MFRRVSKCRKVNVNCIWQLKAAAKCRCRKRSAKLLVSSRKSCSSWVMCIQCSIKVATKSCKQNVLHKSPSLYCKRKKNLFFVSHSISTFLSQTKSLGLFSKCFKFHTLFKSIWHLFESTASRSENDYNKNFECKNNEK